MQDWALKTMNASKPARVGARGRRHAMTRVLRRIIRKFDKRNRELGYSPWTQEILGEFIPMKEQS